MKAEDCGLYLLLQWADGEEFNLLFEFQSERALEVGAESVEMEVVF